MAEYRCPKHDSIFTSVTDHRTPGSPEKGLFPAHPVNGHPDCPFCQNDPKNQLSKADVAKLAAARAQGLAAAAAKAQEAAKAAQDAADQESKEEVAA